MYTYNIHTYIHIMYTYHVNIYYINVCVCLQVCGFLLLKRMSLMDLRPQKHRSVA